MDCDIILPVNKFSNRELKCFVKGYWPIQTQPKSAVYKGRIRLSLSFGVDRFLYQEFFINSQQRFGVYFDTVRKKIRAKNIPNNQLICQTIEC